LSDTEKFRGYARDCVRIAESMKGKDKETLLKIAEAWEERARHTQAKKTSSLEFRSGHELDT
jgi:hypothetical protein